MRHADPRGGDRAQRRVAGAAGRASDDREDRQHAVADEFQHLAAEGVDRAGDAVEPGIERRDDRRRGIALGQRREAAQIGIEQRRLDGLADIAPQRTRQHPRRAAPAEIGLESRRQRGARRESGERRRGEARGLAQLVGLAGRERTRPDPAERGPVRPRSDDVLMHEAGRESGEPAPAGIVRRGLAASAAASPPATNPKASITSPLSARHSQVRRAMSGCGTASVSAPPASGRPSATRRAPSSASSRSAPGVSPAASTSQESVEESCMDRSWG